MGNYKGLDLGQDFIVFFNNEKKKITKILKSLGSTDIKMEYGFYYFMGNFKSKNGQSYYFQCGDVRFTPYGKILYRTVKDYNDHTGGYNQYININEFKEIRL